MFLRGIFEIDNRGGAFCAEKRGWVGKRNAFFEFFLRKVSTTPPPALPVYPTGDPCQPQRTRTDCTAQAAGQAMQDTAYRHTRPDAGHAAPVCTRYQTGHAGQSGRRRGWRAGNPSIMCIMIALSQAWYIDSNMNKYHKDILLFLVIANCYLSIDIPSY